MLPDPIKRKDKYLSFLSGNTEIKLPEPITREDKYLYYLCTQGLIDDEKIKTVVEDYLKENPVETGATQEQVEQIEKNSSDISELKSDLVNITPDKLYKDNKLNSIDITNLATVNANKYIGGANAVGSTIALFTNYDYKVYELSANNIIGYIKYKRFNPAAIHLCITNESDVILALANNTTLNKWAQNIEKPTWIEVSGVYSTDTETFVEINIDLAKSVLNGGG